MEGKVESLRLNVHKIEEILKRDEKVKKVKLFLQQAVEALGL
jgi:hypothetical protein